MVDTGLGYYEAQVAGLPSSLNSQHCYNYVSCQSSFTCDFIGSVQLRLYPSGTRWHIAAVGQYSGYFRTLHFFNDLAAFPNSGDIICNQLDTCADNPTNADDMAIWTPLLTGSFITTAASLTSGVQVTF
jgi:hypothetical protein